MHRDGKNSHFTAIFHPIAMHSTELSHEAPHALKGQKLLAQGSALGIMDANLSPCKGKSFQIHYNVCRYLSASMAALAPEPAATIP